MMQFYFQLILPLHCGCVYVLSVIYHLHRTNGFTTTAPSSPPMDLQAVVGERRLNLAWSPPSPLERNGVITGYKVICTASGLASFSSETAQQRLIVIPLVPYTAYNCCVLALTAAGTGPSICQSFKTKEAGESVHSPFLLFFQHIFSSILTATSPPKHPLLPPLTSNTLLRMAWLLWNLSGANFLKANPMESSSNTFSLVPPHPPLRCGLWI